MPKLILKRSYLDNCTIGKIYYLDELICYSIERPWLNNQKSISCIPAGLYDLKRYDSARHPDCFSLTCHDLGVGLTKDYHRNFILMHVANFVNDVEGCIGPGLDLHPNVWGVSKSKKAMNMLRVLIHNNEIDKVEIT